MQSQDITIEAAIEMVPVLQGESTDYLERLMDQPNIKTFLEIGTAIARTAILAAEHGLEVTTIERDPEMLQKARKNIQESQFKDRIHLVEADAREADIQGQFDLIFIDAAKSQYIPFFAKYATLLSPDGIIVTDNMKFHGLVDHPERTQNRHTKRLLRHIREYRQYLEQQTEWQTEFLDDIGDGLAITRRKKP